MLAPRRRFLNYSKFYCAVIERWLVVCNRINHTCYILHISYTNSQISICLLQIAPFHLITPTLLLRNSSLYFVDFHFGLCRGKSVDIPYTNHFGAIMDLRVNFVDSRTFSFLCCFIFLIRFSQSKLSNNIEDSQQQFEKEDIFKY